MKGADIKAFRKANNLTQKELADYLGIDKGFVSAIEHEKSKFPKAKLSLLLNNPHNWDVSMLQEETAPITFPTIEARMQEREQHLPELIRSTIEDVLTPYPEEHPLVAHLQRKIDDQERLIRELYKEIGMLEAKLELARKGETASGVAGSSCADVG